MIVVAHLLGIPLEELLSLLLSCGAVLTYARLALTRAVDEVRRQDRRLLSAMHSSAPGASNGWPSARFSFARNAEAGKAGA